MNEVSNLVCAQEVSFVASPTHEQVAEGFECKVERPVR